MKTLESDTEDDEINDYFNDMKRWDKIRGKRSTTPPVTRSP